MTDSAVSTTTTALWALIPWISPLGIVVAAAMVGYAVDRTVLGQLKRLSLRSRWRFDRVVIHSLGRLTILWFTLAGVNMAFAGMPLDESAAAQLQSIVQVLIIGSATVVMARITAGIFQIYTGRLRATLPATSLLTNLLVALIYTIGALVILETLRIPIAPILTALGVGGLAVALALQETLANLFAGVHLIISRKVRIGDYIRLNADVEGYVSDITWRNTTITSLHNNTILIPNSQLGSAIVTNFHRPGTELSMIVPVSVAYGSDLDEVERLTIEVARRVIEEHSGATTGVAPVVRFREFGDSGIEFHVVVRVREFVDQIPLRHHLIKNLYTHYQRAGIEIPFQTRTVYVKPAPANGSAPTPASTPPVSVQAVASTAVPAPVPPAGRVADLN